MQILQQKLLAPAAAVSAGDVYADAANAVAAGAVYADDACVVHMCCCCNC